MDPVLPVLATTLASAAVKLLVPYLKEGFVEMAKGVGSEAGKSAVSAAISKAHKVYELVRRKLDGREDGPQTIARLSSYPDDEDVQRTLRSEVEKAAMSDYAFATQLKELLEQVAETKADVSFVNNIQGEVTKLVQIGTVYGDVNA